MTPEELKELEQIIVSAINNKPDKDSAMVDMIKELMAKAPEIVKQIKAAKAPFPFNPVQQGLEDAVRELSKKLTLEILIESPELVSNLRTMLEDGLTQSLLPRDEESQE